MNKVATLCAAEEGKASEGLTGWATSTHQHHQDSLVEPQQTQTSCIIDEVVHAGWETEAELCDSKSNQTHTDDFNCNFPCAMNSASHE